MSRQERDGQTLVYSTEARPAATRLAATRPAATKSGAGDSVRIWLEKKGRNGTPVSIIRGLSDDARALAERASCLKRACGTGGSAKDGEIIIQGDHRERLVALLERDGIAVKLAGG